MLEVCFKYHIKCDLNQPTFVFVKFSISGMDILSVYYFITAETSTSPPPLSTINATPAVNMTEALKQSSRILLLRVCHVEIF